MTHPFLFSSSFSFFMALCSSCDIQSPSSSTFIDNIRLIPTSRGDTSTMSSPPFETLAIGHVQQHYQHQQQQSSAVTMTSITIGGHAATDDDDIIGEEVRPGPIVAQMDDRLKVLFAVLQDHTYGLQSKQQLQQLLATAAAASAAAAAATAQAAASSAVPVTPTAASRSVDGKIVGGYQTSSVSYAPVQMSPSHQNQPPHPSKSASFAFGSSSSSVGGSRINGELLFFNSLQNTMRVRMLLIHWSAMFAHYIARYTQSFRPDHSHL